MVAFYFDRWYFYAFKSITYQDLISSVLIKKRTISDNYNKIISLINIS